MTGYEFTTNSPLETIELGKRLGSALAGGDIIAYKGNLGAGKTTFTRGLCMGLGMEDTVTSPTFAIVNEYHGGRLSLIHFDMYRISGALSLETTGFYDYISDDSVIAVEWSENTEGLLDENITVTFTVPENAPDTRIIAITGDRELFESGGAS
ncbi:MAG: tRNA (adenosine(37)-N6)-threonylcarbamoyltransferase complex ATPase subunit type 1 TsaE [Oscillospiraceae bacterium]|nr:tRNA (adenosine(37)-N6)-threonylcarbamoyltransferase complex ATPase subunit type 1 TsaE [Oscillospiraceae bacterium]